MRPVDFPEANCTFTAPEGMEDEVYPLRAWADGQQVIELWRPSWRERISILVFGRVWLSLLATHPQPAAVEGVRKMFKTIPADQQVSEDWTRG